MFCFFSIHIIGEGETQQPNLESNWSTAIIIWAHGSRLMWSILLFISVGTIFFHSTLLWLYLSLSLSLSVSLSLSLCLSSFPPVDPRFTGESHKVQRHVMWEEVLLQTRPGHTGAIRGKSKHDRDVGTVALNSWTSTKHPVRVKIAFDLFIFVKILHVQAYRSTEEKQSKSGLSRFEALPPPWLLPDTKKQQQQLLWDWNLLLLQYMWVHVSPRRTQDQ